jgi:hypothetical protein
VLGGLRECNMNKQSGIIIVVLALAGTGIFLFRGSQTVDDRTLQALLVGTWRAQDVDNNALNHRKGGVAKEEVVVKPDGTLKYLVIPKPGQGDADADEYKWEIAKGKLRLKLMGPTGTQDALPSFPISIDQTRLTLRRKGFSTKVFERVTS